MANDDNARAANFGHTDLIVRVGPKQERFSVLRSSIEDSSNLLTTTDESDLCSGEVEDLATMSAPDFKIYLDWLCGYGLSRGAVWTSGYDNMFRLYLLSQPLKDVKFRDAILDKIIEQFNKITHNTLF